MQTWAKGLHWALAAWTAGVALQLQQAQLLPVWVYGALGLLGLLVVWAGPWRWWRWLGTGAVAWALTGLHASAWPPALQAELEGQDLDVVGVVEAMPQRQEAGWRFRFRIEQAMRSGHRVQTVQVPPRVYLGWYAVSSRDDALVRPEPVQAGQRWRLRVRLKAAHGHINPRSFDYELWLWEQGIRATGYVRQGAADPPPQRLEQSWRHPVEWARQQVRDRLLARWPAGDAGAGAGGVLAALVTGDQAAIERGDWDVFRATGVSHLMSISGLHVTLLGWLAGRVGADLWRRSALWGSAGPLHWPAPVVGAWLGLAVAAGYALFSGWGVPAQRTVWMLAVATLLRLSARDWHWRQVWSLAAVAVLSLDPWALLQPGFWLSFVAVGVLLATGQAPGLQPEGVRPSCTEVEAGRTVVVRGWPWPEWGRRVWVQVTALWREQALITLALLPLSLFFFGQFSLVGLLANLLAIPWVTLLVTPLALLGVLWPWAWDLAAACLQPLSGLLGLMASWRWASVSLPMPPWPLAAMATAGALMLVLRGPLAWRVWGLPLLLPALLWQPPRPPAGELELLVADVGQGNAVLVRTASHALLYDTGPRYSPESDAGHRVLVPLLTQRGERLDALVLSHSDQDHVGGAQAVLAMQPQVPLWASLPAGHPLMLGRKASTCAAGQSWQWDGVHFEVLHPLAGDDAAQGKSNAHSCVLRIDAAGGSVLLAGDIEAAQERDLLQRGIRSVDVLLVPHHGSKTSSTEAFIEALQPRLAVVQAGYRNRFGHPAPEVVARYRVRQVPLVDSSHCGALQWQSHAPDRWRCEREQVRRYWHHLPP